MESGLDALYTTPPSRFVAHREELALAARSAGRAEDARRVRAARRPSLAAWAANLLLRSEPQESGRFLELGRALREAYGTLDGTGIKELSVQRRRVVAELTRQAAGLALEAGERLSGAVQREIESTLQAVLADQRAADQWAAGRLESALTPPSEFASASAAPAASAGTRPRPARSTAPTAAERARAKDELAERRREKQRLLTQARKAAQAAERRLRDERRRRADADAELGRAHERHDEACQRASAAEEHLRQAREELRRADQECREAEQRSQEAEESLDRAEREARQKAEEVDRLSAR
ncbi:hypothetical protein [Streptomyces sp. NPDC101166]|uniref:hypothetical protein n=1 Tax=Streptomyces sp. NPDC101166 TaxID=3366120 RepID=UPI0038242CF7